MKIDPKYLSQKYANFTTNTGMGGTIIEFFQQFIPRWGMSIEIAATQAIFEGLHNSGIWYLSWIYIPIWGTILLCVGKYYGWMIANYYVGRMMHRTGVWQGINEELTKRKHLNPLQNEAKEHAIEQTKVINAIADKLGVIERAENKFDNLN